MSSMETALPMKEAKERLSNIREYMPGADSFLAEFASYLATRLNPQLVPMGFVMACNLVIYDIQKSSSGGNHGHNPVPHRLTGQPPMIYGILDMYIDQLAEAVFPEEFATEVKAFHQEVNERARQQ